ncbi:MAG: oligosaccharide flippase family protein [Elusimicrobia bacterium]|nr:oligosaccharide flippase family protein [Elusimicrobiota bacterium]
MPLNIKKDSKLKSGINLIIVQFCMFFIPLLAIPYIVGRVGIEKYGAFIFFQAVMGLLSVIGSYGFIQTGVRDVANARTLRKLNYEYALIFYSKFFALLVAIFLGLILFLFDKFNSDKQLYAYSFLFLVVNFLDISFVYQGIEKLKDYVIANLVGNIFYLLSLFVFITDKSDYVYLPLALAIPRIIASLYSIIALYFRFKIAPAFFSFDGIARKIKEGFSFFMTNIFIIIYTRATVVLLGIITNNTYVGYYSIADQLVSAYSMIQGKVSTVYQPQIASAFRNNFSGGVSKAKENMLAISIIAIAGFIFTQFFAYDMLFFLFKENAIHSEVIFKILSLNLISIHLSSIFGIQILLALHKDKDLLKPSIYAAFLNLSMGSVLVFLFKHIGAAVSVTLIEIIIFLYFYAKVKSYGIEVLDRRLIQKLITYTFSLVFLLAFLKFLYSSIDINIYIKFPAIVSLYGLSILVILKLLNIVDFKNRKIIVGHG